jgi:uncharacterized cysteine cluster protein YcgN (CxxCxxCC family)
MEEKESLCDECKNCMKANMQDRDNDRFEVIRHCLILKKEVYAIVHQCSHYQRNE